MVTVQVYQLATELGMQELEEATVTHIVAQHWDKHTAGHLQHLLQLPTPRMDLLHHMDRSAVSELQVSSPDLLP